MTQSRSLDDIQRWVQAVITHHEGAAAGVSSTEARQSIDVDLQDVERVILPSSQMNGLDRLQIYSQAYFGRLIECLRAQFPATRHAVGETEFDGFAFGYLIQHPSKHYSLTVLGDSFDAYLQQTRPARTEPLDEQGGTNDFDFADFLIDLAKLERIYSEVFDGPGSEDVPSLSPSDLAGISPERFARCRLVLHECVRLIKLRFPVHLYATSVRQGVPAEISEARPVYLVVTRRDYVVRRFEVSRPQFEMLSALGEQATIEQSLEVLCAASTSDLKSLQKDVRQWFHDWSTALLFAELVPPDRAVQG